MAMSMTFEELRQTTDEELVRAHDRHAKNTVVGTGYYLDELKRRESNRMNERMAEIAEETHESTEEMRHLTRIVTILTGVNVFAATASVMVSLGS